MDSYNEKNIGVTAMTEHPNSSSDFDLSNSPVSRPSSWPEESGPLTKPKAAQWGDIVYDASLVLIPVALIVKIILCIVAQHKDRDATGVELDLASSLTLNLLKLNTQLTTLFTIVFVSIISTLVRRVALWRAQKGATVAELEQWQSSVSLTGTLKTIWFLRMYTKTSLALVVLWSWYYLGSQATVREYEYRDSGKYYNMNITVTNPQGPSGLDEQYYPNVSNSQKAIINAKYIMSGDLNSRGYDGNRSLLIPFLDQTTSKKADRDGYLEVYAPSNTSYTSGAGVQLYTIFSAADGLYLRPTHLVGELEIVTSYQQADCEAARARNGTEFPAGVLPTMSHSINLTTPGDNSGNSRTQFDIWYRTSNDSSQISTISTRCTIMTVPVQIKALCSGEGCVAKKIKSRLVSDPSTHVSPLNDVGFASRFFHELLLSTGIPSTREETTNVGYNLHLPTTALNTPIEDPKIISELDILTALLPENIATVASAYNLSSVETQKHFEQLLKSTASDRARFMLTPLFNTYLTIWQQEQAYGTIHSENGREGEIPIFQGIVPSPWLTIGKLKGTYWNPQYALSWPWLAVDFISCTILLAAGIAAAYLRTRIIAPDIFGYVSSLTRDNPYIPLPHTASTLDGFSRARLLRDLKVQIADVPCDENTGRVCLVQADGPRLVPTTKLSKGKLYV